MGQEQSAAAVYSSEHYHEQRHRDREKHDYVDIYCRPTSKAYAKSKGSQSVKSDRSSTKSSGYRSGTNSPSESSTSGSDYYHLSLYKNEHYQDVNNNIYKPVKIPKDKLYKLKYLDVEKRTADYLDRHLSIKSYLQTSDHRKAGPRLPEPNTNTKKSGIRNYTPKIITEEENQNMVKNWV